VTEPVPAPRPNRFARLRAATDRVPTKWFATIGTVMFLAATAAFGGLNDVPAEAKTLEVLGTGETHTSPQLAITVQRAVLIDELSGTGAFPDEEKGERLLVLLVEVENRWDRPLATFGSAGVQRAVLLEGDDRAADGIVREDDQTSTPWLQPGVPALIAFSWVVPGDAYAGGEPLRIVLSDATLYQAQLLSSGESWVDRTPAAVVTIPLEDVGAGAES